MQMHTGALCEPNGRPAMRTKCLDMTRSGDGLGQEQSAAGLKISFFTIENEYSCPASCSE